MGCCKSQPSKPSSLRATRNRAGTHVQYVVPLSDEEIKSGKHVRTATMKHRLKAKCVHVSAEDFKIQNRSGHVVTALFPGFNFMGRKRCQDNYATARIVSHQGVFYLFSVFDGHGVKGDLVSKFLVEHFPETLYEHMQEMKGKSLEQICKRAFAATNVKLSRSRIEVALSGSTCTVLLISDTTVFSAWIGDSSAVKASDHEGKLVAKLMTPLHNFDQVGERKRAEQKGDVRRSRNERNEPVGPYRVFKRGKPGPGLAVSRSFGDEMAHEAGVICVPEFDKFDIRPRHSFIILASDGIWDQMSAEDAVAFVQKQQRHPDTAKRLAETCAQRWIDKNSGLCDDISCLIIYLNSDTPAVGVQKASADLSLEDVALAVDENDSAVA